MMNHAFRRGSDRQVIASEDIASRPLLFVDGLKARFIDCGVAIAIASLPTASLIRYGFYVWAFQACILALAIGAGSIVLAIIPPSWKPPLHDAVSKNRQKALFAVLAVAGLVCSCWIVQFCTSFAINTRRGALLFAVLTITLDAAAVLATIGLWRVALVRRVPNVTFAAIAAGFAVLDAFADQSARAAPIWVTRPMQLALRIALPIIAAIIFRRLTTTRISLRVSVFGWTLAALAALTTIGAGSHRRGMALVTTTRGQGSEALVLRYLRAMTDYDGDGFSSVLGGGDCDDADRSTYPGGPNDCDGLKRRRTDPASEAVVAPIATPQTRRVLLITIDTWRCALGGDDLCPTMERRASSASFVGRQRVFAAQTVRSLSRLFGGPLTTSAATAASFPSPIVTGANKNGYETTAILPYADLDTPAIAGEFKVRDRSINARFVTVDSEQTADLAIRYLRTLARRDRYFVWVHFLDPHAPYVNTDAGTRLQRLFGSREKAYESEVRRVDRHVGRLLDAAAELGFDRDSTIIVTGDHGESFDDRALYHGNSVLEAEISVPLFVWIRDRKGNIVPVSLPTESVSSDVTGLLARSLGVPSMGPYTRVSLAIPKDGYQQFSILDGRWKLVYHLQDRYEELFDIQADPDERSDASERQPDRLRAIRQRLADEMSKIIDLDVPAAARISSSTR